MKRALVAILLAVAIAHPAYPAKSEKPAKASATSATKAAPKPTHDWEMNATAIEACSCPMFCTDYFGAGHPTATIDPATHEERRFCRFNKAIKVNTGHYQDVALDGARFWLSGDLGADFAKGGEWLVVTFDRPVTQAQRDAIAKIVAKLYPIPFQSLTTDEADMTWILGPEESTAQLNNGKTAEVVLKRGGFGQDGKTPVIKELQYWGANTNDGFMLMPSVVEAYRTGTQPFEYKGTSGFVITFDVFGDAPVASGEKTAN